MDRIDISKLRKNHSIFMNLGFVIALSMVILAFNWTVPPPLPMNQFPVFEPEEDIHQIVRTPPQRPPVVPPTKVETLEVIDKQLETFVETPAPVPEQLPPTVVVNPEPVEDLPQPIATPQPPAPPEVLPEPEVVPVFDVVEEMPRFPGCEEVGVSKKAKLECANNKLLNYLSRQLKYPRMAVERNVQGNVYVSFVIEETGSISDIKILKGPGEGLGAEALRVVRKMPSWIPGKQRGRPVKVRYVLPVRFRLD
ncbi:MAG: TonB family protein [Bacteroidota bacterium]